MQGGLYPPLIVSPVGSCLWDLYYLHDLPAAMPPNECVFSNTFQHVHMYGTSLYIHVCLYPIICYKHTAYILIYHWIQQVG